jgi:hypothetical protein
MQPVDRTKTVVDGEALARTASMMLSVASASVNSACRHPQTVCSLMIRRRHLAADRLELGCLPWLRPASSARPTIITI